LQDKFGLSAIILESKNYNALRKSQANPFNQEDIIICSYQFAKSKADDIQRIHWDLAVLDEAHRLRNVYKNGNIIARTLKEAMAHVHAKVLLTATPLQNTLLELYGLVSIIDDRIFADLDSFRTQFTANNRSDQALATLRARLSPVCKRTLRQQVQPYVSYTARRAIVQEFTPTNEERELSRLVADYLRRPNLKALPEGQRQLISLVLWKLLASSSRAIAGALTTMAQRLQELLDSGNSDALAQSLDEDYESLADTAEEWDGDENETPPANSERDAIAAEIEELKRYKALADNIRHDGKGQKLCAALDKAFAELERLGAAKKAIIFTESRHTQDYLLELLENTPYGDNIVLFNGSNSDARAQTIYKRFNSTWTLNEKIVRETSLGHYGQIENAMAFLRVAMLAEPPNYPEMEKQAQRLGDALNDFKAGNTLQPQVAANAPQTLPDGINLLEQALTALQNGDSASASSDIGTFIQQWPIFEGDVQTRDGALYARVESELPVIMSKGSEPANIARLQTLVSDLKAIDISASYGIIDAMLVLLREGVEALLVVMALIAALNAARQPRAPYNLPKIA